VLGPGRHHLLFYSYVDDMLERRAPHRAVHLELVRRWHDDGRLELAGALGDPPHGALIVFGVSDAAEIEQFVAEDPYVAAELVTGWRIESWQVIA
jgi:uncharacterized protein YciI